MFNVEQSRYLNEMGIVMFELAHPERLEGYQTPDIILPDSCVLLMVAEECPQGEDASLFIKVLASMKLQPQQALHLTPTQATQLQQHCLEWVWFAGCNATLPSSKASLQKGRVKQLHTPALQAIHGNTQNRRDLWQQICSYDS